MTGIGGRGNAQKTETPTSKISGVDVLKVSEDVDAEENYPWSDEEEDAFVESQRCCSIRNVAARTGEPDPFLSLPAHETVFLDDDGRVVARVQTDTPHRITRVPCSGCLRASEEERRHADYCAADGGEERCRAVLRWMLGRR